MPYRILDVKYSAKYIFLIDTHWFVQNFTKIHLYKKLLLQTCEIFSSFLSNIRFVVLVWKQLFEAGKKAFQY